MKTRAAGSAGPFEDLRKNLSYFIQRQLQIVCAGTKYCIIMSHHPESTSANYFLVTRHNLVRDVIEIVVNSIQDINNYFLTLNRNFQVFRNYCSFLYLSLGSASFYYKIVVSLSLECNLVHNPPFDKQRFSLKRGVVVDFKI